MAGIIRRHNAWDHQDDFSDFRRVPRYEIAESIRAHTAWIAHYPDPDGNRRYRMIYDLVDLRELDARGLVMRDAVFERSNLEGVLFIGADARVVTFLWCRLRNCDFTAADLTGASFEAADLRGAKFGAEMLTVGCLWDVICDDEQLPWLISHPKFSRRMSEDPVQF
jgi:hypothetical protein